MGNKCIAQSGAKFYKNVNYEQYLNETDFKKKYKMLEQVYSKKKGLTTMEVEDLTFKKIRILQQVSLSQLTPSTKNPFCPSKPSEN